MHYLARPNLTASPGEGRPEDPEANVGKNSEPMAATELQLGTNRALWRPPVALDESPWYTSMNFSHEYKFSLAVCARDTAGVWIRFFFFTLFLFFCLIVKRLNKLVYSASGDTTTSLVVSSFGPASLTLEECRNACPKSVALPSQPAKHCTKWHNLAAYLQPSMQWLLLSYVNIKIKITTTKKNW